MRTVISRRPVRRFSPVVLLLAVGFLVAACTPVTVQQQSLTDVNQARVSNGLPALTADPTSSTYAQNWVNNLAAGSPNTCQVTYPTKIGDGAPAGWKSAAMSIGCQQDQGSPVATADTMFRRFMESPHGHKQLILGNYTRLGTAAAKSPSGLWYIAYYYIRM